MNRPSSLLPPCLLAWLLCSASAVVADGSWYVGAGGGVSRLTPDADGSGFELEGETSAAVGAFGGRRFGSRYAFELGATRLGEAELSGDETIEYSVLSGGVLGYVLGDVARVRRGEAAGGFLRLGLGAIDNASDVPLEREDNVSVWAGVGVDVPLGRSWGVRAELASFDGDAQAATVALVWRPRDGGGPAIVASGTAAGLDPDTPSVLAADDAPGTPIASAPTPSAPAPTDRTVVASAPASEGPRAIGEPPAPSRTVRPETPPSARDGASRPRPTPAATSPAADCPPPSGGEPVDERGCARFAGVLDGVDFAPGTATLTDDGARALERLANALLAEPGVTIEIRSHVAPGGDAAAAMTLSRERAVATARHLAGQGVPVARLRARAFGDEVPRAGDGPDERIELDVVVP